MTLPIVPLLVLIVGLLAWALADKAPKVMEAGKWAFIVGLFWTVAVYAGMPLHLR
jgi:hypothetical protein